MSKICVQAEGAIHYNELYQALHNSVLDTYGQMDTQEAITSSAVKTAIDINAKMIVVLTESATLLVWFQVPSFDAGAGRHCALHGIDDRHGLDSVPRHGSGQAVRLGEPVTTLSPCMALVEARSGSTNMLKVLTVE
ncbi:Pyruvate kinase, C-terminal [Phytophthora cactorum]|nr:Pyruvate kinase, C-terminal [Phytophthora cactorum]